MFVYHLVMHLGISSSSGKNKHFLKMWVNKDSRDEQNFENHLHLAIFTLSYISTPCFLHLLLQVTLPTCSYSISKLDETYSQTLASMLIKPWPHCSGYAPVHISLDLWIKKNFWQILCVWCRNSVYGNGNHPGAFLPTHIPPSPPSSSVLAWWQASLSFFSGASLWGAKNRPVFHSLGLEWVLPTATGIPGSSDGTWAMSEISSTGNLSLCKYIYSNTSKCICKCPTEGKKLQIWHFSL